MILTCLASGSSGNCYVLKDDKGKMLLLDAGIPIMKIKRDAIGKYLTLSDALSRINTEIIQKQSVIWKKWESQSTNLTKITPISVAMVNLELYQFQ